MGFEPHTVALRFREGIQYITEDVGVVKSLMLYICIITVINIGKFFTLNL
jgi:hypothetical protein